MKHLVQRCLLLTFCLFSVAVQGQDAKSSPTALNQSLPILTVDDAVNIALENNRLIKNAALEAAKSDYRIGTIRSRRLPQLNVSLLGGILLNPVTFEFPAGLFGVYPKIGPIPATPTSLTTPRRPTVLSMGSIDQPLTQQYKIRLGIHVQELGRDFAREDVRLQRQKVEAEVRSAYFDVVTTQAAAEAARRAVETLQEAQKIANSYEQEQAILKGDVLEIQSRLVKQEYQLRVAENGLATQRERLNQLLAREISTQFRVMETPADDTADLTLESARQRAMTARPEIRQAKIKVRQAEYARRIAKADRIPDVSFSVRYFGVNNIDFVPSNYATAGLYLSWEPFDWGRRRNAVAEQSKTLDQARNGVAETESQIAVEVGLRYRKWQESSLLLRATELMRQARAEQLRVANNKFKENAVLVKDLLQAEAQSSESDYQYQQALSQFWTAAADLRKAMGE